MAPLQSKEMKFGANYMAAPMTTMANADHDHKMGIVPTAPCAEIDLDMSAAAGGLNMMAHSAAPMMDGRQRLPANHKRTRRRSNAICASLSVVLVIFCCVITGLEIRNWMEVTKLQTELQQLRDKHAIFEKYYPVSDGPPYDQIERFDNGRNEFEKEFIRTFNGAKKKQPNGNVTDDAIYGEDETYDDGPDYYDNDDDLEALDDVPDEKDKMLPFDESAYDSTEKNGSRRTRSVSSGDNGIPIIEESYAVHRNPTKNRSVDEHLQQVLQARNVEDPKLNYDWTDKRASTVESEPQQPPQSQRPSNAFPKKYHGSDDAESSASEHHRNTIRHYHHRQQAPQHRRRIPNQYANQHLAKPLDIRHRPLMLQDLAKDGQPKPRRRGMMMAQPPNGSDSPRVRSMGASTRFKTIAAHYEGDTSRYEGGHHEHYAGNGMLRHPGGVFTDWKASGWVRGDNHFRMDSGVVTINEDGLYFVYAQIFYRDVHDTNSYIVERNSRPLFQCTTATHTADRQEKSNTCYTGGIAHLSRGDVIFVRDLGFHRYTLFDTAKSFFGLIKLGDLRGIENVSFNADS